MNIFFLLLATILFQYVQIFCYNIISKEKVKIFTLKSFVIIIISSVLSYINLTINYTSYKLLINLLLLFISNKMIFKDDIPHTFLKSLVIYIIGFIVDALVAVLAVLISVESLELFDAYYLLKFLVSIFNILIFLLLINIRAIRKLLIKIVDLAEKKFFIKICVILFFIIILISGYKLVFKITAINVIGGVTIIFVFSIFLIVVIKQAFNTRDVENKQQILLDFMTKYERIIDDTRVNRHEMLNNLLTLKSCGLKDKKEFENTINKIIEKYDSKKSENFNNIYELPTGLKCILYYKIYAMKEEKLNVTINISKKAVKSIDLIDNDTFLNICKITGILLDNATEASKKSKNKIVLIDIYEENNNFIIYIENSIEKLVDIKNIYNKNYSSKGKNHGIGLYLVKSAIDNNPNFEIYNECDDHVFSVKFKIKNS